MRLLRLDDDDESDVLVVLFDVVLDDVVLVVAEPILPLDAVPNSDWRSFSTAVAAVLALVVSPDESDVRSVSRLLMKLEAELGLAAV